MSIPSEEERLLAFGNRVRELRRTHPLDLSQEAFAAKAQMDRSYVGQIERGEHNISLKLIYKLADALGVSPADLFD